MNSPSPLKQLAAFAICFTVGAVSVMALSLYGKFNKAKPVPSSTSR